MDGDGGQERPVEVKEVQWMEMEGRRGLLK